MTHAAMLAEYFTSESVPTSVIGVPGSVDGDLKSDRIDTMFGFDTACKAYSQLIGNMCADGNSAKKYWYFIRLMGRTTSHIALECALQNGPAELRRLLLRGDPGGGASSPAHPG